MKVWGRERQLPGGLTGIIKPNLLAVDVKHLVLFQTSFRWENWVSEKRVKCLRSHSGKEAKAGLGSGSPGFWIHVPSICLFSLPHSIWLPFPSCTGSSMCVCVHMHVFVYMCKTGRVKEISCSFLSYTRATWGPGAHLSYIVILSMELITDTQKVFAGEIDIWVIDWISRWMDGWINWWMNQWMDWWVDR